MAGRFAPSPTGPLHAGSLVAALAARCDALHSGGDFRVRIDDLDVARSRPAAAAAILRTLRRFGLSDERTVVLYQSDGIDRYHDALRRLATQDLLYACGCSRRELAGSLSCVNRCHTQVLSLDALEAHLADTTLPDQAIRVRLRGRVVLDDGFQGRLVVDLARDVGDIVVHRRDGIVAWPLATACDDGLLSDVVRGADLFEPTVAQIALMQRIGLPVPRYAHVPIVLDAHGNKLGKSSGACAIDDADPSRLLAAAWRFLGQVPFTANTIDTFHHIACDRYDPSRVPTIRQRFDATLAGLAPPPASGHSDKGQGCTPARSSS